MLCVWLRGVLLLAQLSVVYCSQLQTSLINCGNDLTSGLSFSRRWRNLGPFRLGTREAPWGADPLEALGGFPWLPYDQNAYFRSALAPNASVQWTSEDREIAYDSPTAATLYIDLSYPGINWDFQRQIYGWSALQYQAWTRGYIINNSPCTRRALLKPVGILEFYFNGQHIFGGDFYGSNGAPIPVELVPGRNRLDIRLFYDVRSTGGMMPPTISAKLQYELINDGVMIDTEHITAPDFVGGRLSSPYLGIPVRNLHSDAIILTDCEYGQTDDNLVLLRNEPIRIIGGQTRPVAFKVYKTDSSTNIQSAVCFHFESDHAKADIRRVTLLHALESRGILEAHKFTFLHPSSVVSYAIIKPPHHNLYPNTSRPLLLCLHGAGVEADSDLVRHSLDGAKDLQAFVLFPTGMTTWSSDDWHIWGHADVLAAVDAVHDWTRLMDWNETSVTTDQVLVAGHYNGGQVTCYFTTHLPDRTLAAAALSGYTSIENYVPYNFWTESDSLKQALVSMARASFKHELLLDNVADIPIVQQHGSDDDNVPPYNSRLMSSLRSLAGKDSTYFEFPNKQHWWDGALTTKPLREFYSTHLSSPASRRDPLHHFSIVSVATDEMGSKNGIVIEQLRTPDHYGRLDIHIATRNDTVWHIDSSNIRRFRLETKIILNMVPNTIIVDEHNFTIDFSAVVHCFVQSSNGSWFRNDCSKPDNERTGRQRGDLDAILRTSAPFQIVTEKTHERLALQTSRNLFQYFGADAEILSWDKRADALAKGGNVITLTTRKGLNMSTPAIGSFPILFDDHGISLCPQKSTCRFLAYKETIGAIMLHPLEDERLEALVWGFDMAGLEATARLLPTLTGVGQPDFIILGPTSKWRGLHGVLALGFFDYSWNISQASYLWR